MRRLLILLAVLLAAPVGADPDPFYDNLLKEGSLAMRDGRYGEASESLRLACFGLLDEPDLLIVGLVRLAQAQAAAEDDTGYATTVRRIIEVEGLTRAYSNSVRLPDPERRAFEDLLTERTLAEELERVPAFAGVVNRIRAAEAAAAAAAEDEGEDDGDRRASETRDDEPPAGSRAEARPSIDGELEALRTRLGAAVEVDELTAVFTAARGLADANPADREAQLLAAEAAYRISRWNEVLTYGRRGNVLDGERPVLVFYHAIALFETGERDQAATVLRSVLSTLPDTEYVRRTRDKILGN